MAILNGGGLAVDLGQGFEIRAPGITGEANIRGPNAHDVRARGRVDEDGTEALDRAFAATELTEIKQVEMRLAPQRGAGGSRALRSIDNRQEVVELTVPAPDADEGQVVLACDEYGVLTWHLPVSQASDARGGSNRGSSGAKQTFLIPASKAPAAPIARNAQTQRSLIGVFGRKLLKVLVYPLTDPILGRIGELFAERWEEKKRPYGVRNFTPQDFRDPNAPPLTGADWKRLAGGRALLFIHGTFSTAHGAFSGIRDEVMAKLYERYQGRVFAFDHFTLSHDPGRNVQWFLTKVPADCKIDVDIVCHSRGGLVARALAERPSPFQIDASRISVRRIVYAGVPNQGTQLAQPDHMVKMIDRLTSAMNLFPTGPVTEFLEALITAVKVIGHAGLKGLNGLAAMDPAGQFIKSLNNPADVSAVGYAIAADFEPADAGMKELIAGSVVDSIMDRVFEGVKNDLVVPYPGVFEKNGGAGFPIPTAQLLQVPANAGVMHTTLFGYEPTNQKLLEWLEG